MTEQPFDNQKYGELLAQAKPALIETPEDHERLLNLAESLMDKGEGLAREERRLLELLVFLIEAFERSTEPGGDEDEDEEEVLPPHQLLERLLENRGFDQSVLTDVFGNPAATREALTGARPITKGQAKQLSRLLNVPPRLFLPD